MILYERYQQSSAQAAKVKCASMKTKQHGASVFLMNKSHYSERACALDFKDASVPRFGHSDIVFDLFIEMHCFAFNCLLIQFFKAFLAF